MKFAFMTCVQLGLSCIEKIYDIGGKLDLLITLHDHKSIKKSGRIYLDDFAKHHEIEVYKINHINDREVAEKIRQEKIDWLFIIGWSQIAGGDLLNTPTKGVIGMHPTLLPIGRGRASIPWAILKGLKKTGVTMFKLDSGVDTGPIIAQYEIPLTTNITATELYSKVNLAHEALIAKVWEDMRNDSIILIEQDESKATYWEGRSPKDGEITKNMTVEEVDRLVRATTHPYPGAFMNLLDKKIIIWKGKKHLADTSCNEYSIRLSDGWYEPIDYTIESKQTSVNQ